VPLGLLGASNEPSRLAIDRCEDDVGVLAEHLTREFVAAPIEVWTVGHRSRPIRLHDDEDLGLRGELGEDGLPGCSIRASCGSVPTLPRFAVPG